MTDLPDQKTHVVVIGGGYAGTLAANRLRQLEHLDIHGSYGHHFVMLNTPAIAPVGEARSNNDVFRALAAHLGSLDAVPGAQPGTQPGGIERAEDRAEARREEMARRRGARLDGLVRVVGQLRGVAEGVGEEAGHGRVSLGRAARADQRSRPARRHRAPARRRGRQYRPA